MESKYPYKFSKKKLASNQRWSVPAKDTYLVLANELKLNPRNLDEVDWEDGGKVPSVKQFVNIYSKDKKSYRQVANLITHSGRRDKYGEYAYKKLKQPYWLVQPWTYDNEPFPASLEFVAEQGVRSGYKILKAPARLRKTVGQGNR